ncbi:hypothetical protein H9X96_12930 [Pedobacter sp. N36a]|uniref:MauE/DoxX family redox-associated membrane protein n=1 Tax=Pedobacter sp. N36a TaxID=2767996 RepID=UPI0016570755|nr:MauE/DoxX family redox-associated membrane protein [Pedobacter sp. N36a]MBC8986681.1 hypothetical protein [Pedobacter sp. N36a]
MKSKTFTEICAALIILLFAYTAVSKLLEYDKFIFQMKLSPLSLMAILAPFLAWVVPLFEIILVGFLLFPKVRKVGFIGSIILLTVFEVYILGMLVSGLHLPCTCGGIVSMLSWKGHLFFNAFFIAIAYLGLRLARKKKMEQPSKIEYSARPEA